MGFFLVVEAFLVAALDHKFDDDVNAALGCHLYGFRVTSSAVFNRNNFFSGSCVFKGFDKDFDGVFLEFLFDDFKGFLDEVIGAHGLSGASSGAFKVFFAFVAGYHNAVDESFNNEEFALVEAVLGVSTTRFGYDFGF